ncbi:7114_t:CDS:2 [Entrophospora sp. SA101]|nr:7114_t:CDS:2 [Entrophospora sp. SA101]
MFTLQIYKTGVKNPLSIYQGALVINDYRLLIHQEMLLGGLGIFSLLVRFAITFFLCYQFYLIYYGTTSNEAFKWEDLDEMISNDELWVYDGKDLKNKQKNLSPSSISLELHDPNKELSELLFYIFDGGDDITPILLPVIVIDVNKIMFLTN